MCLSPLGLSLTSNEVLLARDLSVRFVSTTGNDGDEPPKKDSRSSDEPPKKDARTTRKKSNGKTASEKVLPKCHNCGSSLTYVETFVGMDKVDLLT
jgi:hypothetical protein